MRSSAPIAVITLLLLARPAIAHAQQPATQQATTQQATTPHVDAPPASAEQSTPFGFTGMTKPTTAADGNLTIFVSTKGTPPDVGELEKATNWRLLAKDDAGYHRIEIDRIKWQDGGNKEVVSLIFAHANMNGLDHAAVAWRVIYLGAPDVFITEHAAPSLSTGRFKAAKGKEDAFFYGFGSLLVGSSTKPLWVIDVKFDYTEDIGFTPWSWALRASANTNTTAKPPADEVEVDADAIEASLSFERRVKITSRWLHGLKLTLAPFKGQFSRETFVADGLTTGEMQLNLATIAGAVTVYPKIGYELGHTLRKPDEIDDRPVDLGEWNALARATAGVSGQWTLFKADPTPDDLAHVTFGASYIARFLGQAEPFVESEVIDGKRASVTTLDERTRHTAEAELNWNFLKYTALSLKYRYGSQPPLYRFSDHQWTIGLTVKAARKSARM